MSYLGCTVRLFSQLFVGGLMSYLGCSVRLFSQLFVGGFMSYKNPPTNNWETRRTEHPK
jgi:predicted metal-binding membrane protein